ncbi:MAG TPA: hypothetical protein VME47_06270 [Acetobacteraceae bacterium]|nr:hypothetical protein [Acetobacteraceae bacterium]
MRPSNQSESGFIDHALNKKPATIRDYLPPDANTLPWVTDHCPRTWKRVSVIVAGKQPAPQWLTMEQAIRHCAAGSPFGRLIRPWATMACGPGLGRA